MGCIFKEKQLIPYNWEKLATKFVFTLIGPLLFLSEVSKSIQRAGEHDPGPEGDRPQH